MLSKILYGTAVLQHGNLRFTALAAGPLGRLVKLSIAQGSPLAATVTFVCPGAGTIAITAPAGTTELQLLAFLNLSAHQVKQLTTVALVAGDGTAVVSPLVESAFSASGGLVEHLRTRLGIANWADRDQVSSGAPVGFVWPKESEITRMHPDREEGFHNYKGVVELAVVFQSEEAFEAQNSLIDFFRRALVAALFTFDDSEHGFGSFEFPKLMFHSSNAPQSAGQARTSERADLLLRAAIALTWTEPAYLPVDEIAIEESQFNVGLFNEPLDDPLGDGGGEILDQPPIDLTEGE